MSKLRRHFDWRRRDRKHWKTIFQKRVGSGRRNVEKS
jgi:hypothetical protein